MEKVSEGIHRRKDGRYRIRVAPVDPETGERLDRTRTLPASVTTLKEAEILRQEFMREVMPAASYTVRDRRVVTVGDYAVLWYERRIPRLKPMTRRNYLRRIDDFILPFFEDVPIEELTRGHVEEWVTWSDSLMRSETQGYSVKTRRGWWNVLKMIMLDLHAECGLDRNPVARVRPPKVDNGGKRSRAALSRDELATFIDACETMIPPRFAEVYMLATTGMRPGEAHGLMWECVDWENGDLTLRRSASKGVLTDTTKSGYHRHAPMCPRLAKILREHRKQSLHLDGLASKLVFPSTAGTPRFSGSLRKSMNRVAEAIGLEVRVGPQTLRRTFNTLMLEAGVSEVLLRSTVGHRSPEMTHLYASVTIDAKHQASKMALGAIIS